MKPTTTTNKQLLEKSLSTILKEQSCLYDLHAHLLGMGNAGFWIDTILMDDTIMPTNETFRKDEKTQVAYCPLVWDNKSGGFVNGKETARFFYYLVKENIFRKANGETIETTEFQEEIDSLRAQNFPTVLIDLIDKKLYDDLIHGCLEFKEDFSYDVVLELSDLGKGLGIQHSDCEGFVQLAVIEKLGCHLPNPETNSSLPNRETKFQHWITFNVKEQKFKIVYGIQVEQLRKLIYVDQNNPSETARLARAHIINAFSMCDAEGTRARHIDLHSFHGSFTPEFYPRRFALKDSIYSQRLDILAALIAHIIERYQTCSPPVKYCELSVSVNDLSTAWIFDVLRSVRIYDQKSIKTSQEGSDRAIYTADRKLSSFSQFVLNDHFPYLRVAYMGPTNTKGKRMKFNRPSVMYKFLAGFDRRKIVGSVPVEPEKALNFLYVTPHKAILLMMKEIEKSKKDRNKPEKDADIEKPASHEATLSPIKEIEKSKKDQNIPEKEADKEKPASQNQVIEAIGFDPCVKKLERLKECADNTPWFHQWVVGLDLFGDELGYPYCPFVARPFINFVLRQREKNPCFGLRIHCGENVKFAKDDNPAYRLFVAHMYIVFSSLLFLQEELGYGIRIGHGIAFDHILGADSESARHRKSSVLMADMRNNAFELFQKIAFEVNITSNEYLLGQTLRQGDYKQILPLKKLFAMKAQITLGTDDDGIWPIDQCSSVHPGHHSLAAEYCRAISTAMVDSPETLNKIFQTTKKVCFWDMKNSDQKSIIREVEKAKDAEKAKVEKAKDAEQTKEENSRDDHNLYKVIVHPDIIRLIRNKYNSSSPPSAIQLAFEKHSKISEKFPSDYKWTNEEEKLRVAFVCMCANANEDKDEEQQIREEYIKLFGTSNNDENKFHYIYENWKGILSSFVSRTLDTHLQVEIKDHQDKQKRTLIRAVSSQTENPFMFLNSIYWWDGESHIRIYAPTLDMKITDPRIKQLEDKSEMKNGKGTLHLYTNTNKYLYTYKKVGEELELRLNPTPSRRATKDENFLYVLCKHAGAATAAVHLVSEQLLTLANTSNVPTESTPIFVGSAEPLPLPSINENHPGTPGIPSLESRSPAVNVSVSIIENPQTIDTKNESQGNYKRLMSGDDSGDDNNHERVSKQPKVSEKDTQVELLTQQDTGST